MQSKRRVEHFPLHTDAGADDQVVIPSVRATWKLKYGEHAYYILDFAAEHGMCLTISHTDIIRPGLDIFKQAAAISDGRFIVGLWSYPGYLLVDSRAETATYHSGVVDDSIHVLGSRLWFDSQDGSLYGMSFSLQDSLVRIDDTNRPVTATIFRHPTGSDTPETLWHGEFADYLHDIVEVRGFHNRTPSLPSCARPKTC